MNLVFVQSVRTGRCTRSFTVVPSELQKIRGALLGYG